MSSSRCWLGCILHTLALPHPLPLPLRQSADTSSHMLLFTSLHVCIIDIWAVGILPFLESHNQGQMQMSSLYLQPCSVCMLYTYMYTNEHINLLKPLSLTTSAATTELPVMWCQSSQGMSDWVCGVACTDTNTHRHMCHITAAVLRSTLHIV